MVADVLHFVIRWNAIVPTRKSILIEVDGMQQLSRFHFWEDGHFRDGGVKTAAHPLRAGTERWSGTAPCGESLGVPDCRAIDFNYIRAGYRLESLRDPKTIVDFIPIPFWLSFGSRSAFFSAMKSHTSFTSVVEGIYTINAIQVNARRNLATKHNRLGSVFVY